MAFTVTVGEAEIDLNKTHQELVEIEKAIAAAKTKHNGFLKELGLDLLPWFPLDKSSLQQQVLARLAEDLQQTEQAARAAHETALP